MAEMNCSLRGGMSRSVDCCLADGAYMVWLGGARGGTVPAISDVFPNSRTQRISERVRGKMCAKHIGLDQHVACFDRFSMRDVLPPSARHRH